MITKYKNHIIRRKQSMNFGVNPIKEWIIRNQSTNVLLDFLDEFFFYLITRF